MAGRCCGRQRCTMTFSMRSRLSARRMPCRPSFSSIWAGKMYHATRSQVICRSIARVFAVEGIYGTGITKTKCWSPLRRRYLRLRLRLPGGRSRGLASNRAKPLMTRRLYPTRRRLRRVRRKCSLQQRGGDLASRRSQHRRRRGKRRKKWPDRLWRRTTYSSSILDRCWILLKVEVESVSKEEMTMEQRNRRRGRRSDLRSRNCFRVEVGCCHLRFRNCRRQRTEALIVHRERSCFRSWRQMDSRRRKRRIPGRCFLRCNHCATKRAETSMRVVPGSSGLQLCRRLLSTWRLNCSTLWMIL